MSRSCSPIRGHARATRRAAWSRPRKRARARGGVPRGHATYCCSDVEPLAEEMQATFLGCPEEGAGVRAGKAFELDEASYARHGEATALELKKDTRTRAEASEKGKGGEKPSEAFDRACSRRTRTRGRTGAQNGAKGDVHETTQNPTNAQETFVRRAGDVTDSSDARDADKRRIASPLPRPRVGSPPTRWASRPSATSCARASGARCTGSSS